jgi:ribonuclease HI
MIYTAYTDGASDNTVKIAGCGVVVYANDTPIFESAFCMQNLGSSNDAEYTALLECFKFCAEKLPGKMVTIFSDSQIIVRQFNGQYRCKQPHLKIHLHNALQLSKAFLPVLVWIPREQNKEADILSKLGLNTFYND